MADPEIVFRHGPCSVSVFSNKVEKGDQTFNVRSVSFQKTYMDKNGHWQTTTNLKVNDIPKAVLVLNKAFEFLTANHE